MRHLSLVQSSESLDQVNLFDDRSGGGALARQLREEEQRERLQQLARKLAEMLDTLDQQVRSNPERAAATVAEYTGLLEKAVGEVCEIRDIDEEFGSQLRRRNTVASMAERLERGLSYLVGVFSVVATATNIGRYNWKLVERDIQEVLSISRAIANEPHGEPERKAA